MEVSELLAKALAAVDAAEIPPELREVAFSRAVDLLVASPPESPTTGGGSSNSGGTSTSSSSTSSGDGNGSDHLGKVSNFFGVTRDDLEEVYAEHEGALQVVVDPSDLGTSVAAQARGIGILLISGRQVGEYDTGATQLEAVRAECDRHGIYDSANFSTQMNDLKKYFNVNGEKQARTYKLKPPGRAKAKEMVTDIVTK